MKRLQFLSYALVLASLVSGCASTGSVKPLKTAEDVTEIKVADSMSKKVDFHVRKRFIYLVAWNNIPVGRIIAESDDMRKYRGRDVYVVRLMTESNKFLSKIYRVEDTYTSYVDAETMTSRRYEADRKEGNYRKHLVVEYDFDNMEAIYTNLTDGSVKKCRIRKNVQDPVSTVCYFMTLPKEPGEVVNITVNLNEKNYDLFGKVEDFDIVKLPDLGSFPAFKIRPYALLKGQRYRKGRGWMYFAADARRYPLYGVVLIPFGRVTATLKTVEDI